MLILPRLGTVPVSTCQCLFAGLVFLAFPPEAVVLSAAVPHAAYLAAPFWNLVQAAGPIKQVVPEAALLLLISDLLISN